MIIDFTNDVREGLFKALSDIGNTFPIDDKEINSIIEDVIEYSNEENK